MRFKLLLPFFFILLFSSNVHTQGFLHVQGLEIVDGNNNPVLLRGMGLGGWMLQEGYMMQTASFANAQYQLKEKIAEVIGEEGMNAFYDAWLENYVQKVDIDSMKAWGFNSIRLPMHYNLYTLPIEDEPIAGEHTWLTKGFELTDSLLSWCAQNEMYLILDLHAAPGGQGKEAGISDYDPTKPSLWESKANRDKTVALWKKLAERYVGEPWIGGYDLINETNWELPNNNLLRAIYLEITDSIRTVDQNHIIFIEGNWFANDFTNLGNPWDDNMVYSPHKYWNFNDDEGVDWMLDIGEANGRPVWMGESGENSNTWFRDAISLMEDRNLGWAWWPWKKIDAIAGTVSIPKNEGYQDLLNYWEGNGPKPSAAAATAALMEMTEWLKLENATIRRDVIDAMFRQIGTDETLPYVSNVVPGIIYASNYDLGPNEHAYLDMDVATYHVSSGAYTAWNKAWNYRNDGVDIEVCEDDMNTNGYNVGFLEQGEWMQYEANVQNAGVYQIDMRVASEVATGQFHWMIGDVDLSRKKNVPPTGAWQTWTTLTVDEVVLEAGTQKLRLYSDGRDFNLSSFDFSFKGASNSVATTYLSGKTSGTQQVILALNKEMQSASASLISDFRIFANNNPVTISAVTQDPNDPRVIIFDMASEFIFSDLIRISYSGTQLMAKDGTSLQTFNNQEVQNLIPEVHEIPGRIQAEAYFEQVGIQTETCTDEGGGLNVGYTDIGDYMDYSVNIEQAGEYRVDYRTASLSENGAVELHLRDESGWDSLLHRADFTTTGAWQNWQTFSEPVDLPQGEFTLRVVIVASLFNLNWFEFTLVKATSIEEELDIDLSVFPNPNTGRFNVSGSLESPESLNLTVYNLVGQKLWSKHFPSSMQVEETINLEFAPAGTYLLRISDSEGNSTVRRVLKQ